MPFNVYSKLKSEYAKKQKLAHDKLMQHKKEIYSQIPRIEEIDNEIMLLGVKYNKEILLNGKKNNDADNIMEKIYTLEKEKSDILYNNGYGEDYLKIKYKCSLCNDTGFINTGAGAVRCSCYKQKLINYLYTQSNLKITESENFDNFNYEYYSNTIDKKYGINVSPRDNITMIESRCRKFIKNFESAEEKSLYFCGPAGTGKTFMANCIAREILDMGKTVIYQTAPRLFDIINEQKFRFFKNKEINNKKIYNDFYDTELLIIDDLGTEPRSASRYAEFLNILNIRNMNNAVSPCKTIISSNLNVKQLYEYYDERIASRIIGCFNMYRFAGDDIRRIKKLGEFK